MEQTITFEDVCEYAKNAGFAPRGEESKAKDYTQTYWHNPWAHFNIMVLYEGEKRTLRGHEKPEVCWICIDCFGNIMSIPSRHIRMMDSICGFGLTAEGRDKIIKYKNNIQEAE